MFRIGDFCPFLKRVDVVQLTHQNIVIFPPINIQGGFFDWSPLVRFSDPHYVVGREIQPLWDGAVFFRGP